jgi:hypothetical protein
MDGAKGKEAQLCESFFFLPLRIKCSTAVNPHFSLLKEVTEPELRIGAKARSDTLDWAEIGERIWR